MAGYRDMPERTVEAWRNLWFHTGDAGVMAETGYVTYVDRIKDCIRRRGENISSFEVELAISRLEGVAEVARQFKPRLVVVFAGAARPRGPFHVTMDNNDALETAHAFPDARIVVIHNSGWKHFSESAEDTVKVFTALGVASRLITLEPGKPLSLPL